MLALVTATWNSMETLEATLDSITGVRDRVRHVFVDGDSSDGTYEYLQDFVSANPGALLVKQEGTGLYEAINQGIEASIGMSDVSYVGLLHSDDVVVPENYLDYLALIEGGESDIYFSDIQFHDAEGSIKRVWRAGEYSRFRLRTGWMPPHTSVVVSSDVYQRTGLYSSEFGTAADYEWTVRLLRDEAFSTHYFRKRTVSMRIGGASGSSLAARLKANRMDGSAWRNESIWQAMLVRVCKPTRKIFQFR